MYHCLAEDAITIQVVLGRSRFGHLLEDHEGLSPHLVALLDHDLQDLAVGFEQVVDDVLEIWVRRVVPLDLVFSLRLRR